MIKNVLVYRLSALGDVAMTLPAIYSCAQAYRSTIFHVVTTRFCSQLFVNAPLNVLVHAVDKPVTTRRVLKLIGTLHIDAVADLHNVLRSWIVDAYCLLKGHRVKMLDKQRDTRRAILGGQMEATPYTDRYFDVFARLGLPCTPSFTSLFSEKPPLPIAIEKGPDRWIGIAPFARYTNKTYPAAQMQAVIGLLAQRPDTRVFLFGSRGNEARQLDAWAAPLDKVTSVAGRYTLSEEMQLMVHLDAMLTMDSSNMHLASLVGTRVVSVWGSTTPACGFMGYGQQKSDALCANLVCQPCTTAGSRQCKLGTLACMTQIKAQQIVDRLLQDS